VGTREARKLRAQRDATKTVWFGLGMLGLIGWSVAVPTLLGIALGIWIDREFPGGRSWTLMLLIIGLGIGCWNAWHWVRREQRQIQHEEEESRDA
jgi:ATP synthase protein I